MKSKKLGIELIHHTHDNTWYQYINQCTFWDKLNGYKFQISRLEIKESETELIFYALKMKEYLRSIDRNGSVIIYYGCDVIQKLNRIKANFTNHVKNAQ